MAGFDMSGDAHLLDVGFDPHGPRYTFHPRPSWPTPMSLPMDHRNLSQSGNGNAGRTTTAMPAAAMNITATSDDDHNHNTTTTHPFRPQSSSDNPPTLLTDWPVHQTNHHAYGHGHAQDTAPLGPHFMSPYGGPFQTSPIDFMPSSQPPSMMDNNLAMDRSLVSMGGPVDALQLSWEDFPVGLMSFGDNHGLPDTTNLPAPTMADSSPTDTFLEVRSLTSSGSEGGWGYIDYHPFESYRDPQSGAIFNPSHTLHLRTDSESSYSDVAANPRNSFESVEEIPFPMMSPESETHPALGYPEGSCQQPSQAHPHHQHEHQHHQQQQPQPQYQHQHQYQQHEQQQQAMVSVSPSAATEPVQIKESASPHTSPSSQGLSSPPPRRQARKSPNSKSPTSKSPASKSPTSKSTKPVIRRQSQSAKKDTEKRVGRRKGPLRPDQRKQASEIRKLRACLRCKFLKKTFDQGSPCAGCQPAHARLWQVPCTRIDIKDVAYFMKDWKADYERYVNLGVCVGNIKSFSPMERTLNITHGYGFVLPIKVREVYVRDEKCFLTDWTESFHETPRSFEVDTAALTTGAEGISAERLSHYLDQHVDGRFEEWVDEYFEGTPFLTEILKTAHHYYLRSKLPVIRKALKLVVAYNLTMHVTMVDGLSDGEILPGKVTDETSKYKGRTVAPVMINVQIKCAMAEMWRELQKEILGELSALYSSVYSGDKLKHWPTIFMLAAVLLAVWEEMQFDSHYRIPDPVAVDKFCTEMETTPVGVIVGLFSAISQKLPSFSEWDTRKHHTALNSDSAVCDAMTEIRQHVNRREEYLKTRSNAIFDREDFDCLSNKFLSKLVIRAN